MVPPRIIIKTSAKKEDERGEKQKKPPTGVEGFIYIQIGETAYFTAIFLPFWMKIPF